MTSVKINEFSTGIRYQTNADGSWFSLGFTGQYMNVTCESIPHCIKRSIANKEFAVSEGASSDKPAIIGRVVLGGEEGNWSVVALVSKGWDEKGRSASFYRYFFSEREDNLPTILTWLQEQRQLPIFNPTKIKQIGQAHSFSGIPIKEYAPEEMLTAPTPILIPANEEYALAQINALATHKVDGQPISWAFNVEALEQPWRFIVIQAGSTCAYQLLQKAIANPPKVRTPVVADEQALTSALKSLIGRSTVKPESLETIIEALTDVDIEPDYWEELFNNQGARNALRQNIYGSQMVRLLTLRTLAIPVTLREYLEWLNFDENLNKRNLNQPIITALEFQSQLLPLLRKSSQIYPQLNKLLHGLKSYYYLAKLFDIIGDYINKNSSDHQLATLYYKLSAYLGFSTSRIPKNLFEKAFPNQASPQQLWDRIVHIKSRKGKYIVPRKDVFYLLFLAFALGVILGGGGGYLLGKSTFSPSNLNSSNNQNEQKSNPNDLDINNHSPAQVYIDEDKKNQAINKFETDSLESIKKLISDFKQTDNNISEQEIIDFLKQNLGQINLNDSALVNKNYPQYKKHRNEWIDAIFKYQKNNNLVADGIISPQDGTINLLEQRLKEKLSQLENPVPTPGSIPVTGE